MSSFKDDEELARALQEEYQRDYEASRTRQQQQQERPPPPTAPAEDIRPVRPIVVPPPPSIESDEQLARRLSQEMNLNIGKVEIVDATGKVVKTLSNYYSEIKVDDLTSGFYQMRFFLDNQTAFTKPLVISRK